MTAADSLTTHTAWVQAILDRTNAEITVLTDRLATLTTERDKLNTELVDLADLADLMTTVTAAPAGRTADFLGRGRVRHDRAVSIFSLSE